MDQTITITHPRIGLATASGPSRYAWQDLRAEPIADFRDASGSRVPALRIMATDGRMAVAVAATVLDGTPEAAWIPRDTLRSAPTPQERRADSRRLHLNGAATVHGLGKPDRTYPLPEAASEPGAKFPPLADVVPTLARDGRRYATVSLNRDLLAQALDALRPIAADGKSAAPFASAVTFAFEIDDDDACRTPVAILNGAGQEIRTDSIGVLMPIGTRDKQTPKDQNPARIAWREALARLGILAGADFDAGAKTR